MNINAIAEKVGGKGFETWLMMILILFVSSTERKYLDQRNEERRKVQNRVYKSGKNKIVWRK